MVCGLAFVQSDYYYMVSSGCRPGALYKLHFDYPSALSSTLTLLRLISSCMYIHLSMKLVGCVLVLEEGDGRCVRASWPYSIKLSILNLLLNPPSVFGFTKNFVVFYVRKCSPFLSNPWATP